MIRWPFTRGSWGAVPRRAGQVLPTRWHGVGSDRPQAFRASAVGPRSAGRNSAVLGAFPDRGPARRAMAVLNVRVDDHVRDQLKGMADADGLTLSEYVRDLLLAAVVPVYTPDVKHGDEPAPESMRTI